MDRPLPPALALAVELHAEGRAVYNVSCGWMPSIQLADTEAAVIRALADRFGAPVSWSVVGGSGNWSIDALGGIRVYGVCRIALARANGAADPVPPVTAASQIVEPE